MPSFGDIKDRASKFKDTSVNKVKDTRDRYQSTSSKNLDWDPNHKPPPPAPISRAVSNKPAYVPPPPPSRSGHPSVPTGSRPPVIRRDTRPDQVPSLNVTLSPPLPPARTPSAASISSSVGIDWSNLSEQDKETLFSWLDEYFARRFNVHTQPGAVSSVISTQTVAKPAPASRPPILPTRTRSIPAPSRSALDENFTLSFPPATQHGTQALDLAYYFHPTTYWDSPWYAAEQPVPPPIAEKRPSIFQYSWEYHGSKRVLYGVGLFEDLSYCWYTVQWDSSQDADPNYTRAVQRSAQYLPRPQPWDQAALVSAHETYGETIAGFAESYEGTGQWCGTGECWDLASDAFKYFAQFDYVPKPLGSTARTHGHLIFEGKAVGAGLENQIGRWRGGDDRVRRGDIVQWITAKLKMPNGGEATMGAPDHTAVIVSECMPSVQVRDGMIVKPGEVGTIEVVEQSKSTAPKRAKYDLKMLREGELWIYRPVGMVEYLGTDVVPKCPEHVGALSI